MGANVREIEMLFTDRTEAGKALARALIKYKGQPVHVYALPRGGAQVAAEVARALGAPLDLILVRKIGAPMQPELAMGAVVDGGAPIIVRNDEVLRLTGTNSNQFDQICRRELQEIERRRKLYMQNRPPLTPAGKIAIVIDDGVATGATMRAALQATRMRQPRKLILAVPVGAHDSIEALRSEVDEVVCLSVPEDFGALGYYYDDFRQLSDQDVIDILKRLSPATVSLQGQ
jgi:predicted phosphoribosyltransferase